MHDLCIFLICFCSKIIFDQNFFSICWDKLDYPGSIVYLSCFVCILPFNVASILTFLFFIISLGCKGMCMRQSLRGSSDIQSTLQRLKPACIPFIHKHFLVLLVFSEELVTSRMVLHIMPFSGYHFNSRLIV